MNVFVLCTGRCGSVTFAEACKHITNFTTGHESHVKCRGAARVAYPENHIEVDNRLIWFTGALYKRYGKGALYVHLIRNEEDTAASFAKRADGGIIAAYRDSILLRCPGKISDINICKDYCQTVNENIRYFLHDKPNQITIHIETAGKTFPVFWDAIGAAGNMSAALRELKVRHHRSV